MMWQHEGWWNFGMGFGVPWPLMFVFLGLLLWGGVLLVRKTFGTPAEMNSGETPLDILQRRLAAGEVSLEEYENIREKLA
ncbi:MAG: hypothetical protein V3S29_05810 [bacterium]